MKLSKKAKALTAAVLAAVIVISLSIWIAWGNKAIVITEVEIADERIPESFQDFRIAQVSDLHNEEFGKDNVKLLSMLKDASPDIIVLTGDIIDARSTDVDVAVTFAKGAVEIAPCYYVTGNHEMRVLDETERLIEEIGKAGVTVLKNESVLIERGGETINLIGIPDYQDDDPRICENLTRLVTDGYDVALSHRPNHHDEYFDCGPDLVLCGHAHGGQVRLPFLGGIFAPGQKLFPEYEDGVHTSDDTTMIISRGLGNSLFPFRVNNRPEIVVVKLASGE